MIHMESLLGAMHCAESWGNKDKIKTLSLRNSEPKERETIYEQIITVQHDRKRCGTLEGGKIHSIYIRLYINTCV